MVKLHNKFTESRLLWSLKLNSSFVFGYMQFKIVLSLSNVNITVRTRDLIDNATLFLSCLGIFRRGQNLGNSMNWFHGDPHSCLIHNSSNFF